MQAVAGRARRLALATVAMLALTALSRTAADDPPPLNPFGKRTATRRDARPGVIELSDGSLHVGSIYLTRDARLRIYDGALKRHREIPLRVVRLIECEVEKEWMEREWRFKEAAADEKVYTGRRYPARIYVHRLTLDDGRTIRGPLSAPIYLRRDVEERARRFILHKRDKGPVGSSLKSLLYVKRIELGEEAAARARIELEKQAQPASQSARRSKQ